MAEKKKWYQIVAPKMFDEKPLAETLAAEPEQLIGRTIEVSLMNLTKDYSRFYMKMLFQVERVEGDIAYTKFVGHDVMRDRIYRMVQRRVRRVDVIQDVTTTDGVNVRIKTVVTLNRRVNTALKDAARHVAYDYVNHVAERVTLEQLIGYIIKGELQKALKKECNHIYPISDVEIRKTELLTSGKTIVRLPKKQEAKPARARRSSKRTTRKTKTKATSKDAEKAIDKAEEEIKAMVEDAKVAEAAEKDAQET